MRWVLIGVGLFVVFAIEMAGSNGARSAYNFLTHHQQTTGILLSGPDPKNHLYSTYSYTVNGITYRSFGLAPNGVAAGQSVTVTYATNDPENSKMGVSGSLSAAEFWVASLTVCLFSSAIVTVLLKEFWKRYAHA